MHLRKLWQRISSVSKPRAQAQPEDCEKSSEQTRSTNPKNGREAKDSKETQTRTGDPDPLVRKSLAIFRTAEPYLDIRYPQRKPIAKHVRETPDKGNLELLRDKERVTVATACKFGGVKQRAIQAAVAKGALVAVGERQNRRISVESLLKYFPPENSAR